MSANRFAAAFMTEDREHPLEELRRLLLEARPQPEQPSDNIAVSAAVHAAFPMGSIQCNVHNSRFRESLVATFDVRGDRLVYGKESFTPAEAVDRIPKLAKN
jgi:hypothetical protein